jgi:hypothetical protein
MADPDVKSNLGAFAQYGQLAAGEELKVFDAVGAIVGTVGDFAGALGAVAAVVSFFASLGSNPADAIAGLAAELGQVDRELRQLIASERVDHLLTRLHGLDSVIAPSISAYQSLRSELPPNPAPGDADRRAQIGACLSALNALVPDDQWEVNVLETSYYDDGGEWAGQVAAQSSGGIAFGTWYVLPRYMTALANLYTVGVALDPAFAENYRDAALKPFLQRLQAVHETARAGLVALPRPTPDEVFQLFGSDQGPFYSYGAWGRGRLAFRESVALHRIFYQMYGVVSVYGTYFLVGNYPVGLMPPPAFPLDGNYFNRYFALYDLRMLGAMKSAYQQTGLASARASLRRMQRMSGLPELPAVDADAVWSARELASAMAPAFGGDGASGKSVSMRSTLARLNDLAQGDPGNTSLRQALALAIGSVALEPLPEPPGPDPEPTPPPLGG